MQNIGTAAAPLAQKSFGRQFGIGIVDRQPTDGQFGRQCAGGRQFVAIDKYAAQYRPPQRLFNLQIQRDILLAI